MLKNNLIFNYFKFCICLIFLNFGNKDAYALKFTIILNKQKKLTILGFFKKFKTLF